jgi:hypothetical protein
MEIKATAIDLVWVEEINPLTGHVFLVCEIMEYIKLSIFREKFSMYFRGIRLYEECTLEEAKAYAQSWANDIVASIAKPFVVPDGNEYEKFGEYGDDGSDFRDKFLRENGIDE